MLSAVILMKFRLSALVVALFGVGYCSVLLIEDALIWREDALLLPDLSAYPPLPVAIEELPLTPGVSDGLRLVECIETGIDFRYENGATGGFHLAETLGGGVAAADYDCDGRADLIFVDGGDPVGTAEGTARVAIFRQRRRTQFQNVTFNAGCDWFAYGHGCAVAM